MVESAFYRPARPTPTAVAKNGLRFVRSVTHRNRHPSMIGMYSSYMFRTLYTTPRAANESRIARNIGKSREIVRMACGSCTPMPSGPAKPGGTTVA